MALVIGEGIAQKASKVLKYTKKVGLNWDWLEALVKIPKNEGDHEIKPNAKFLDDIVAGRPIFCYPSAKGGFRLRYGRSRMTGIAAKAVHPATMYVLDSFIAVGTQMRVERPGKGCVVSPCDSIEGPVVRLRDGSVVRLSSGEEAKKITDQVVEVLSLGDILVSYGDFRKSNHPLMPSAWCEEWWALELEKAGGGRPNPEKIGAEESFRLSEKHGVALHPRYTYLWHDITPEQLSELAKWVLGARLDYEWFRLKEMLIEASPTKRVLEELCVPHTVRERYVVLDPENAYALLRCLGALKSRKISMESFDKEYSKDRPALETVNKLAGVKVVKKAPTYIGARMGRPEKAKERLMKPAPNVLFPVGEAGGKIRSIVKAYRIAKDRQDGGAQSDVARLRCPSCGKISFLNKCPNCGVRSRPERTCVKCGRVSEKEECFCGSKTAPYDQRSVELAKLLETASQKCGGYMPDDIKGVRGMSSKSKIPEPLEKGILRAKHRVFVFKDGTARFDATDMVLTHFKPVEVGVSVERLRALGYEKDYKGNELKSPDQLLELNVQDVLIAENGADYFMGVANFVDDLLIYLYGLPPFYKVKSREDMVGQLVVGLSPHTSCGVLGRIVGFTKARVGFAHPYFHSAKRRNCDGDEDSLMLLMDALLNFSREFLPESRGSTMDASIVLSTSINPTEIDDEVHAMETCSEYPLELYHKSLELANPGEIKLDRVFDRLGKKEEYDGLPFTHHTNSIDDAPLKTTYVELKSMRDKVGAQFGLTSKIRAVDNRDAAERVILSHFLPDLYGNLRAFSRQEFRCVSCNAKYRRVPLRGKCNRCGEKLLLTVNKGGIEKYLKLSQEITEKYDLPSYLKQRLALLETEIGSVFEDETNRQFNLAEFM
jgi:DNA polymerase II large subunit